MKNETSITAILLMGGSGNRLNSLLPKQFHLLKGWPVYQYALETFLQIERFEEILLVSHPNWLDKLEHLAENKKVRVVAAGLTRQESSYLGLLACKKNTTHVVIHDAVRPFVSKEILYQHIEAVIKYGAVDTCIPSSDTIVHSIDGHLIDAIPPRQEYLRGQTPQSFEYDLILNAHIKAIAKGKVNASDDCQLIIEEKGRVYIIKGEERNIKITTELDLELAQLIN